MKAHRFLCLTPLAVLPAVVQAQDKPCVFISESQSWSSTGEDLSGGIVGARGIIAARQLRRSGARPQTPAILKTFNAGDSPSRHTPPIRSAPKTIENFNWHYNRNEGGIMKKLSLLTLLLVLGLPLAALAQDEAAKVEMFGGYAR